MKQANKLFSAWYGTLPRNEYRRIREELIDQCGITRAIFYNWTQGITPIPPVHYEAINRVAGKKILEPEKQEA